MPHSWRATQLSHALPHRDRRYSIRAADLAGDERLGSGDPAPPRAGSLAPAPPLRCLRDDVSLFDPILPARPGLWPRAHRVGSLRGNAARHGGAVWARGRAIGALARADRPALHRPRVRLDVAVRAGSTSLVRPRARQPG